MIKVETVGTLDFGAFSEEQQKDFCITLLELIQEVVFNEDSNNEDIL